jgi:hypothetical protein
LELVLSARHEVFLVRARALRSTAIARAVNFAVKSSVNLSRAVFFGLVALAFLLPSQLPRDHGTNNSSALNVEIVRTHPVPASRVSATQTPSSPAPADPTKPAGSAPEASKPATPPAAPLLPPAEQKAPPWTDGEIAAAKAECARLLDKVTVVAEPLPPAREGVCGAPAPRELRSLGEGNVKIQPPATLTCPMVAALNTWVSDKLQPAAKKSFGSPVVRILAESYSCRNRYGLARAPISEHAFMNAIDVSAFVLENGKTIRVSKSWGQHHGSEQGAAKPDSTPGAAHKTMAVAAAKLGAHDLIPPNDDKKKTPAPDKDTTKEEESAFLHEAHNDACKIFGTVLGPDANEAHHNHFHLDMKARKYRAICE